MLTREEHEPLCRVGPESPIGGMLRQYWLDSIDAPWQTVGAADVQV